MDKKQLRGLILEEVILVLLSKAGYRILKASEDALIKNGKVGLEVQGRGEWHQIDALVAYDHTPAFLFPIRLGLEAKAYFPTSNSSGKVSLGKVEIKEIRNAVGVVKDLNENYFSSNDSQPLNLKRYNYVYSIFSLYGFTKPAQRYAVAHQIYLIQYYHNHLFEGIKSILRQLEGTIATQSKQLTIREILRDFFRNPEKYEENLQGVFGDESELIKSLLNEVNSIGGSYFGSLNGEYPIHILSEKPIADGLDKDEYEVEFWVNENGMVEVKLLKNNLYFELPRFVAQILQQVWADDRSVADIKKKHISFITLSGIIGGVRRNIKLKLDNNWLNKYVSELSETLE